MTPEETARITDVFRAEHARTVAVVARAAGGDVELAEDAVSDAFEEAVRRWPDDGLPTTPGAWILTTARRKALDRLRREQRRDAKQAEAMRALEPGGDDPAAEFGDDQLTLIFTCCHPALPLPAQVALTLRLVGGLDTAAIARAFMVSEPTMRRRLTRAKAPIRRGDIALATPAPEHAAARLDGVLAVLYLIFNEGYVGSQGATLTRDDLSEEAIALTRTLLALVPAEDDVRGLLALMLFIHARRSARVGPGGELVALPRQDRARWDRTMLAQADLLLRQARRSPRRSRYTVEAEIQALHAATIDGAETDWRAVLRHYDTLRMIAPSPPVELNRTVALAEVEGPEAALAVLDTLPAESHLWHAVRADLLERLGRTAEAELEWRRGMGRTENRVEQAYMATRSTRHAPPAT